MNQTETQGEITHPVINDRTGGLTWQNSSTLETTCITKYIYIPIPLLFQV